MRLARRRFQLLLANLCVVGACQFAAGCDLGGRGVPSTPTRGPIVGAQPPQAGTRFGQAFISHSPTGTAVLIWDSDSQIMKVTLSMNGMTSNVTAKSAIQNGGCSTLSNTVYQLNDITADDHGKVVNSTTQEFNVQGGLSTDWSVVVSTPGGSTQPYALACGVVTAPGPSGAQARLKAPSAQAPASPSFTEQATVQLGATGSLNQNVSGVARLEQRKDGTLIVNTQVSGLIPNTSHAESIHAGNCTYLEYKIYDLPPLNADDTGYAFSAISINHSQFMPTAGWYVQVGYSTDPSVASDQPIGCGDIQVNVG
jgi:hypothetical protein